MEQRNLIMAVVLSLVVLLGWQLIFPPQKQPVPPQKQEQAQPGKPGEAPGAPGAARPSIPETREEAIAQTPRIKIDTPAIKGSISVPWGRIDDIKLVRYRENIEDGSPPVTLLSPTFDSSGYFSEHGWLDSQYKPITPTKDANAGRWQVVGNDRLSPGEPVTLRYTNSDGLEFSRIIEVDDKFMFTITQTVRNASGAEKILRPYARVMRRGKPDTLGFFILHEGPVAMMDERLQEDDYDNLKEQAEDEPNAQCTERDGCWTNASGWLGFTNKYWLTALIPTPGEKTEIAQFRYIKDTVPAYQSDYVASAKTIQPGGEVSYQSYFFAGAKEVDTLTGYRDNLNITNFEDSIDFGWFFFITKPFLQVLIAINDVVGNYGITILIFTLLVKIIFLPLANKSYKSMSKMKQLQPKMQQLKERFGDDKVRLQQEMMGLYKKEKINPASGCLPIIAQIPVFFALYKVLFVAIELRHEPFFGWIQDLSAADPTTIFNLFGLIPWTPPDFLTVGMLSFLSLGIWPILMGLTMFLQQRLNPAPTDPTQAKIFMFLPIIFTFMLSRFPAGLVIYWAWNNLLSMAQQAYIMRRMGMKVKFR